MKRGVPVRAMLLVGTLFLCLGCDKPQVATVDQSVDLFAQGEFLCRETRWGEAREVLREFLLDHPDHAGAHFYLGRSYLWWEEDFRPVIALGELQTALALYKQTGEHHIERYPDEYFEIICDMESAKVFYRQASLMHLTGVPPKGLLPTLNRGWEYIAQARQVDPDHPDIANGETLFRDIYTALGESPPSFD